MDLQPHATPLDPRDRTLGNWVNCRFDALFRDALRAVLAQRKRLVEVGCGGTAWLPYFARELGFDVCGLDDSPAGCTRAAESLARAAVDGEIVCAGLFDAPTRLGGRFDVVFSFGVVDDFADTAGCLQALGELLAPGGILLTVIPNMTGMTGWLQKLMARDAWDVRAPLSAERLHDAHEAAGLRADCRYFLPLDTGVVDGGPPLVRTSLWRLSKLIWAVERATINLPATALLSPYIVAVAKRASDR